MVHKRSAYILEYICTEGCTDEAACNFDVDAGLTMDLALSLVTNVKGRATLWKDGS